MRLELPIGNEDFASLANKYYVDKTMIIKEIIEKGIGSTILITRPRRFGKTLMMSMIESFFDIEKKGLSLFEKYAISKEKALCEMHANQYPVVRVNMKDVYGSSSIEIIDSMIDKISLLYRTYPFLQNSHALLDIEKEEYLQIVSKKASPSLISASLSRITMFLSKHYGKKVVLLLDEYDSPIERAYECGCYEALMDFVKPLYGSALKGNGNLLFGMVTGVLQIAKESLFSGLNNLMISSVCDQFLNSYFGFSISETEELLSYYAINEDVDTLRQWYGGYNLIGDEELLNPWSILHFVLNKRLDRYWVNTGSNEILRSVFSKRDLETMTLNLIGSEVSSIQSVKEINYRTFDQEPSSLLSFLIQTGYVSLRKNEGRYESVIPNWEVRDLFTNEIIKRADDPALQNTGKSLRKAILSSDIPAISNAMREYVLRSFTYYDLRTEKDYQNILSEFLSILFEDYAVKNEVMAGDGRCDILLFPKKKKGIGIILEIKRSRSKKEPSKSNLSKMAKGALKQIYEKNYLDEFKNVGVETGLLYGFAFHGKTLAAEVEPIDLRAFKD